MRDLLWGNDVGALREVGRLALKVALALVIAWCIHEALARCVFFKEVETQAMADQVNAAFRKHKVPVGISIEWRISRDGRGKELGYHLTRADYSAQSREPSDEEAAEQPPSQEDSQTKTETIQSAQTIALEEHGDFYKLRNDGVTHPQVTDSLHVLARRAEKVWKGERGKELLLCAESRKALAVEECAPSEAFRSDIESSDSAEGLGKHLDGIKLGSLVLGPWQWLTLAAFIFALVETVGLWLRWVRARSYVGEIVDNGLDDKLGDEDKAKFDKLLAIASGERVRAFVDRFLEKALSKSTTPAESRLRNFRDMQVDECVSKLDTLEAIGDTMLKIAFMGTVFGIGTALFAARNLDAADPLLRLVAKSEMYAGIGMGFGATLVGILLSILAAKLRAWLSGAWLSAIDDGWRRATMFYDANYGGHAVPPTVPGVSFKRIEYRDRQKSTSDAALDAFLTTLGYVGIIALLGYVAYHVWIRYGGTLL